MYNPSKISRERTPPPLPLLLLVLRTFTYSILLISHQYCHALHILTANLCLNILHV